MIRWAEGVLVATLSLLLPTAAFGQDAAVCIERNESAQGLRSRGDLLAARPLALACAEGCPAAIASDCSDLAARIEAETPTVIFGATRSGKDLVSVQVKRGAETIATSLTGQAQRMNPGPTKLEFVAEDGVSVLIDVVLKMGEKNRLVMVELAPTANPTAPVGPTGAPPPTKPETNPDDGSSMPPALFWILGGVSVATFAGAGVAGGIALGLRGALDPCIEAKTCAPDDVEAVERTALISDVLLGAGAALAVGAVLSWVFWPSEPAPATAPRIGFIVGPESGAATARWEW
jgi:hypothetical protein